MDGFLPVVIMVVLGMVFASMGAFLPGILAVRRPTLAKEAPYECGIVPTREPAERFPVRFYLIAMIFIIFDIEIIFLYPWAVIFDQLGLFGLVEMVVFAVAVIVSFGYLLSNGALDWGPTKSARSVAPAAAAAAGSGARAEDRSSRSTVRKVSRGDRAA